MRRLARAVVPSCPHHVTERGNRHEQTFLCADDGRAYRALLREWCGRRAGVCPGTNGPAWMRGRVALTVSAGPRGRQVLAGAQAPEGGPIPGKPRRGGTGLTVAFQACGRSGGTQPPRAQRPRRSRGSEEETDRRNRVTTEGTKDTENEKKHPGAEEAAGEPRRGVLNSPGRRPKDKPGVSGLRSSPQSRLCLQAPAGRLGLTAGFNRGDRQDRRYKAGASWGRRSVASTHEGRDGAMRRSCSTGP